MVYSAPFVRVVMSGSTFPLESFSVGLNLIASGGVARAPTDTELDAIVTACSAWFSSGGAKVASLVKLRTVKANLIAVTGKYANPSVTLLRDLVTPVSGGNMGVCAPQLTTVLTFTTGAQRGAASKGRMFPPLCAPGLQEDGRLSVAVCQEMANAGAILVNSLNLCMPGHAVGIVSDVGVGQQRSVKGVQVGRVIDTQRRRRRSMPEERVPATTVVTGF